MRTHGIVIAMCQSVLRRNSPQIPNEFGGIEEKRGREERKGKKREKKKKKKEEEPISVSFWLPNGKILRTRCEVAYASRGRGSLLLWLLFI